MIRRDIHVPGEPLRWGLVSQVDHARISGELAREWIAGPGAELLQNEQVISAIAHHDDGWADWEQTPQVDPVSGRPLNFLEMPPEAALAIWRKSIAAAERIGPLAALMVAGHFSALLTNTQHTAMPAAQQWLSEYAGRQAKWLADFQASRTSGDGAVVAARAVRLLQFFDGLSLWLCCAERTQAHKLAFPEGSTVVLTPRPPIRSTCADLTAEPWPFRSDALHLAAECVSVPARKYAGAEDVTTVERQRCTLAWHIKRDS